MIIISLVLITGRVESCIHSETMAGRDNTEHSKWFVQIQKKIDIEFFHWPWLSACLQTISISKTYRNILDLKKTKPEKKKKEVAARLNEEIKTQHFGV